MLWRALKGVQGGFYIDVGAHEPINGSVTKAFYDRGWNGINIEPITTSFELLKAARLRDINLQLCAGAENGEIDIYDVSPSGLATTLLSIAEEYRALDHSVEVKRVPVQTLSSICREYVTGEIHFLKIDVEGFEKEVLLGIDFLIWRPWIIIVEATYPNSSKENYSSWEDIVLDKGYKFAYFDGLNRFYVSVEHKELLSYFTTPPNYFDDFALSSSCIFSREVTAELHQAEAQAQQAEAKAEQLHTELHSVYTSRSWRITAPLRWFIHRVRLLRQHGLFSRIKAVIKKIVRPFIRRGIAFVDSHPGLRLRLVMLIKRLGLYGVLRFIYLRFSSSYLPKSPLSTQISDAGPSNLQGLTPHARRIYADLKDAITKQQRENS